MKKRFKTIIATALILATAGAIATASGLVEIPVWVNNSIAIKVQNKNFKAKEEDGTVLAPLTYNDRTYLPVRAISEALGAYVDYEADTQTVIIATATPKPTPTPKPTAAPKPTPTPLPTAMPEKDAVELEKEMHKSNTDYWAYITNNAYLKNSADEKFDFALKTQMSINETNLKKLKSSPAKINTNSKYATVSCKMISPGGNATVAFRSADTKEYFGKYYLSSQSVTEVNNLPIFNCKNLNIYVLDGAASSVIIGDITFR